MTEPAPHVFNASMGARLEVLYASPQIVAQRRRFRTLLDLRAVSYTHLTLPTTERV